MLLVIQIREFEYSPEAQESRKQELEKLMQDQESKRNSLLLWCYASYGEVNLSLICIFPLCCNTVFISFQLFFAHDLIEKGKLK